MPRWTKAQLKQQYARAKTNGWLPLIQAAAEKHDFTLADLLGVASRETNLDPQYQEHPGDRGHGFSMWQIDIGSFPDWIKTGDWKDVGKAVEKAASVLASKRDEVKKFAALHGYKFPSVDALRRTYLAAYNHGSKGSELDQEKLQNPDLGTTGHDYGNDTLNRIAVFQGLIDADAPEVSKVEKATVVETDAATGASTVSTSKVEVTDRPVAGGGPSDPPIQIPQASPALRAKVISGIHAAGGISAIFAVAFGFAKEHPILVTMAALFILALAAFLWESAQRRAQARTLAADNAATDPKKQNIIFS